jgi:hypothetical protein
MATLSELVDQNRNVLENYLATKNYTAGYELMKAISTLARRGQEGVKSFLDYRLALCLNLVDESTFTY